MPLGAFLFTGAQLKPWLWLGFLGLIAVHQLGHLLAVKAARARLASFDVTGLGGECRTVEISIEPGRSRFDAPVVAKPLGHGGACIDAQLLLGVAVHFMKEALAEMLQTGRYTGIGDNQFTTLRKEIEDMIGLDTYYEVEAETVEKA